MVVTAVQRDGSYIARVYADGVDFHKVAEARFADLESAERWGADQNWHMLVHKHTQGATQ